MNSERGTGRTSAQITSAPDGAFFICSGQIGYTRRLAKGLRRKDLQIVSVDWLETRWRGITGSVVLDHALKLTERQIAILDRIKMHMKVT